MVNVYNKKKRVVIMQYKKIRVGIKSIIMIVPLMSFNISLAQESVRDTLTVNDALVVTDAEKILIQAQKSLEEAEYLAQNIVEEARLEAAIIIGNTQVDKADHQEKRRVKAVDLDNIMHQDIFVEISNKTLEECLLEILPIGWRVKIDLDQDQLKDQRIDFIAEKKRDEAIDELTRSIGLSYRYFAHLTDSAGNPRPLLVVVKNNNI